MIIDWKKIAKEIYDDLKNKIEKLDKKPSLWAILVWNNSSSLRYIEQKKKWAKYVWIEFNLKHLNENIKEEELLGIVKELNNDENISGYIIQLPLPSNIDSNKIISSIDSKKDVDWFTPENQWKICIWDKSWLSPCTPAWIMYILEYLKVDFNWKEICVIWRSNIVWKPITNMLLNTWATVTNCNSKTKDLKSHTLKSDIIISAAWMPGLVKEDMVKNSAIIIDVGFTVKNSKIYWDVEYDSIVSKKECQITPVPWWVWALTVAMLMNNTFKAYKNHNNL
jgi:methylenetetrahydrofolate dehydrogenase (NADP+)/methenyltetrahydrofolate cyclohydrolase